MMLIRYTWIRSPKFAPIQRIMFEPEHVVVLLSHLSADEASVLFVAYSSPSFAVLRTGIGAGDNLCAAICFQCEQAIQYPPAYFAQQWHAHKTLDLTKLLLAPAHC